MCVLLCVFGGYVGKFGGWDWWLWHIDVTIRLLGGEFTWSRMVGLGIYFELYGMDFDILLPFGNLGGNGN